MMKKIKIAFAVLGIFFCLLACGKKSNTYNQPQPEEIEKPTTTDFSKGADISWVTELEANGHKFYNRAGEERECTALMKELGLDAIRLRVWVDPKEHDNWCNTEDLVVKAKRAKNLGMDIMVDFHYSDWWADPGQQHKPASWKGLNLPDLKIAIANHTKEVLEALKKEGISPKWVQVGNEIRPGMLWDEDASLSGASYDIQARYVKDSNDTSDAVKYPKNFGNLAAFINVGYDAVKAVFPESIVIVHLDNGYDESLYTWFFDELKKHNGKWDMIGMSIYPYWTMLEHKEYTTDKTIDDCIKNINTISQRYDCDIMIVETGMQCADENGNLASNDILNEGKRLMTRLLKESKENTNNRCKGVFYWEPECKPSQYQLGAFTQEGRPTAIMDAFR